MGAGTYPHQGSDSSYEFADESIDKGVVKYKGFII